MNDEQAPRRVKRISTRTDGSSAPSGRRSSGAQIGRTSRSAWALSGSTAFFVALVVLALLKAMLMRHYTVGGWNLFSAVVLEGAFVLVVLGVFDLIPPRRNYWLDLAVYSALSILMLVLTVYVSFYSQLFNPSMMSMAGQLGTVKDVVKHLIRPTYALFLIDIPFLAAWAYFLGRAEESSALRAASVLSSGSGSLSQRRLRRSRPVMVLVVLATLVFGAQIVLIQRLPSWVDGVAIAHARGLSAAQVAAFFPRASDSESLQSASAGEVDAPPESGTASTTPVAAVAPTTPGGKVEAHVEKIRGSLEGTRVAGFPVAAYRGKNVIIIQVESLDGILMQKSYDGQEITPNLNKLIQESWYWPNMYSETGIGNTADAEFIVNTSLYAPQGQATTVKYANRILPGLPRVLSGLGYDTFTIHPNHVLYWNRKQMYEGVGFNRYYDSDYFHGVDTMGEFGSSDEELFKRTTKLVRGLEASSTPFYSQIITLSAHGPFEFTPEARRPVKTPPELAGSLMGKYISAESYSDLAIGEFIDNLKATKLWDNSIVVIYGDHSAMLSNRLTGKDGVAAKNLLGRAYGPADRQRIPLIIHLPKQTTPVLRTDVAGQVDVMPTVADLVGADLTQIPHMGRSLFVSSNAMVPLNAYLPGGTFVNDRVVFMPGLGFDDGTAVKVSDDSKTTPSDVEKQDFSRMLELTRISDAWVMSLPMMKNTGELGWIPDPAARKAAKPYGFLQQGIGSKKDQ